MSELPLDPFAGRLDPGGCRIINLPNRLWVFGGPIEEKSLPSGSLRDSFLRQAFIAPPTEFSWLGQLDYPEQHNDWWAFTGYSDLLQFERDACHLARGTVLFAESPGALVELGALAADDTLVGSLLVVASDAHSRDTSFIALGPLKRVELFNGLCLIGTKGGIDLPEVDFSAIAAFIENWLPRKAREQSFNHLNHTHVLLLLADLIDLLIVAKEADILQAARFFGVNITSERLIQLLKLLNFFQFINIVRRGLEVFYARRTGTAAPWVTYKGTSANYDRGRFKVTRFEEIEKSPRLKSIRDGLL